MLIRELPFHRKFMATSECSYGVPGGFSIPNKSKPDGEPSRESATTKWYYQMVLPVTKLTKISSFRMTKLIKFSNATLDMPDEESTHSFPVQKNPHSLVAEKSPSFGSWICGAKKPSRGALWQGGCEGCQLTILVQIGAWVQSKGCSWI